MDLGAYGEVVTPIDDPCQFRPDWRSVVAGYLFSQGVRSKADLRHLSETGTILDRGDAPAFSDDYEPTPDSPSLQFAPIHPFDKEEDYRALALDSWIASHIVFYNRECDGGQLSHNQKCMRLARRWYVDDSRGAVKTRLEPLLLTDVSLDVVSLDISGGLDARPAIETYEKMYFNCRDNAGNLSKSLNLTQSFATPFGELKMFYRKNEPKDDEGNLLDTRPLATEWDVWKSVAATMGYDVLMNMWQWQGRAHGLKNDNAEHMMEVVWRVALGRLASDMLTGMVSHEDVARNLATLTSQAKYLSDNRKTGGESEDTTRGLLAILQAVAPKMREITIGGEGAISDEAIRSRIASQRAIDAQEIEDKGRDVSTALVNEQIASAIKGE